MIEFFVENFENYIWLAILIMAMVPTLEGRIAIPFGLSAIISASSGMTPFLVFICAFFGSIIPCFFIIPTMKFLINKSGAVIFNKKNFTQNAKFQQLANEKSTIKKICFLAGFVAIPLPLTGVWTGSLIACFSTLKIWQSILAICTGSFISCMFLMIISIFFGNKVIYFLIISIAMLIVFYLYNIIYKSVKRKKTS